MVIFYAEILTESGIGSCFVEFFLQWNEWKNPQFNFLCQNLSVWYIVFGIILSSIFNYFTNFLNHLSENLINLFPGKRSIGKFLAQKTKPQQLFQLSPIHLEHPVFVSKSIWRVLYLAFIHDGNLYWHIKRRLACLLLM